MCRIAGLIAPHLNPELAAQTVQKMCGLLKHGGPDDEGISTFPDSHTVLGNRRLSLLDLTSAGHQPMHYRERFTITYNGELYNFLSLKNELIAAGHVFKNHTDTEVILAAFAQWHTESFSKLNGMFAFALWDNECKQLFLVRDAAGIKPLYYSTSSGSLAFASEIRAFQPVEHLQEKNPNAAVYLLAYGHIPEPVTTLSSVRPLPKGCWLKYDTVSCEQTLQSFRFFSFSNEIENKDDAKFITKRTLQGAVERQMIADAPIGVFLSGGLDSSVIALLAESSQRTKSLNTLSIWFEDKKYSEKPFQDIVSAKLSAEHHGYLLTEKDFHSSFNAVTSAMDMPAIDGINTWFISRYAASVGLKAVLSGTGGDELFGGYPSFKRMSRAMALQNAPSALVKLAGAAAGSKYKRSVYLGIPGIKGLYLFLRGYFTPSEIAKQLDANESEVWSILNEQPAMENICGTGSQNTAGWMEFHMYLQNQLLRDADVMGMANGVEIRVPFLDNEVITAVFAMNEKLRYAGPYQKQLLIDSFIDILPEPVWNRKKMGFSFPFAEWMKNNEAVKEMVENNNKHKSKLAKDFLAGKEHWSKVMAVLVNDRN